MLKTAGRKPEPDWTIVCCPGFAATPGTISCNSETVIALNFAEKTVLICGTGYAGEIKKSVFTVLNYILPLENVLPMHCAANHAPGDPDDAALFFGLSGTGKTTLSADPQRILVGDDEHGWVGRRNIQFRRRLLRQDLQSQRMRRA